MTKDLINLGVKVIIFEKYILKRIWLFKRCFLNRLIINHVDLSFIVLIQLSPWKDFKQSFILKILRSAAVIYLSYLCQNFF